MDMDIGTRRRITAILAILRESEGSLGSRKIARELESRGIDLKERMVRYYLDEMDELGFTENLGRPGRRITEKGMVEMDAALAVDRVGFVSARVDQLSYQCSYDVESSTGTVIMNVSSVPLKEVNRAKAVVRKVIAAGLGMGRFVTIAHGDKLIAGHVMPKKRAGFGTICSVSLNGVFLSQGIPVVSRFGGLVEMREGKPVRFTQIINYDGTTIDPIEIFIKGHMTMVNAVVKTGTGVIGASFREIPASAHSDAEALIKKLDDVGLNGVLLTGQPGKPVLDVPVSQGRVGLVVAAGLNPIAAVEESGIPTESHAMAALCGFEELEDL